MIKYFFSDGINEFGPYSLNDLKTKSLRPDYKIRTEVKTFISTASSIPELDSLFKTSTPVQQTTYQTTEYVNIKNKTKSKSDILLIIALSILGLSLLLMLITNFAFNFLQISSIKSQYIFIGIINLLKGFIPLLIALSIKNKDIKIIGIIIAVILTLSSIFSAIQIMITSF